MTGQVGGFQNPGVCKRFLPFLPTLFPLFYLHHFLRGPWLSFLVFAPNRTETLTTQAKHGHVTTSFMSHYQELLVSFFQSKETYETDIFFSWKIWSKVFSSHVTVDSVA